MRQFFRAAWHRWKVAAEQIGHFQARLIFGFLYFLVVTPFALAVKTFSDPLRLRRPRAGTFWHELSRQTLTLEDARKQF
ncbi:MAG: hypothetical protein ACREQY_10500 [Candidatus Binatia bacterium]